MRYADLDFHHQATLPSGHVIEQACVSFPNGWALSILRGMKPLHMTGSDFEVAEFHNGELLERSVRRLMTEVQVQSAMHELAARP